MNAWFVAGALLGFVFAAQAQVPVKCQDKNGRIVYVDRPCEVYGLHEIGPVKDRVNVGPAEPPVESKTDDPASNEQSAKPGGGGKQGVAKRQDSARERAVKRCKENRGVDCESEGGLREYLREDRPITVEQQQAAGAARRLRDLCAKDPTALACQDPDMQ